MDIDFANLGKKPRKQRDSQTFAGLWLLLFGILIGATLAVLYIFTHQNSLPGLKANGPKITTHQNPLDNKSAVAATTTPNNTTPSFDFYNTLPNMQIDANGDIPNGPAHTNTEEAHNFDIREHSDKLIKNNISTIPTNTAETTKAANNLATELPPKADLRKNLAEEAKLELATRSPLDTASPAEFPKSNSANKSGRQYFLQLGAFRTQSDAQKLANSLRSQNYSAQIKTVADSHNQTLYKIWVGPFESITTAHNNQDRLKASNYPSILLSFVSLSDQPG